MLEENEYIRTDLGEIAIVTSVIKETLQDIVGEVEGINKEIGFCNTEPYVRGNIVKHSKNIIDLIEVGDYVNGFEVIETDTGHEVDSQIVVSTQTYKEVYLLEEDIDTILTKEQYEANCYTVEKEEE